MALQQAVSMEIFSGQALHTSFCGFLIPFFHSSVKNRFKGWDKAWSSCYVIWNVSYKCKTLLPPAFSPFIKSKLFLAGRQSLMVISMYLTQALIFACLSSSFWCNTIVTVSPIAVQYAYLNFTNTVALAEKKEIKKICFVSDFCQGPFPLLLFLKECHVHM